MTEPRFTPAEMAHELDKLVYSKATWLADHGQGPRARPEHEIEIKRREKAVLEQAAAAYHKMAERAA